MSVKLAFSTGIGEGSQWGWEMIAERAKLLGFAGVEVDVEGEGVLGHHLLTDVHRAQKVMNETGLEVPGLITGIALHSADREEWEEEAEAFKHAIERAMGLGCLYVGVTGYQMTRGENQARWLTRLGQRLGMLAAMAASQGFTGSVLLRNAGGLVHARTVWTILEMAGHPQAGVCWDVGVAARYEENASVSVPLLNRRIRVGRIWDGRKTSGGGIAVVDMGTGDWQPKEFVDRLRGVGFSGWLSYGPPARENQSTAEIDAELTAASKTMRSWLGLPELGPDGQVVQKVEEKPAVAPVKAAVA